MLPGDSGESRFGVFGHAGEHASRWAAIGSLAGEIGCTPEALRISSNEPSPVEARRDREALQV